MKKKLLILFFWPSARPFHWLPAEERKKNPHRKKMRKQKQI